jgi:hypothetical protein
VVAVHAPAIRSTASFKWFGASAAEDFSLNVKNNFSNAE